MISKRSLRSNAEKFEFQAEVSWLAYGLCSAPKTLIKSPFRASRAIMGDNNYICRFQVNNNSRPSFVLHIYMLKFVFLFSFYEFINYSDTFSLKGIVF